MAQQEYTVTFPGGKTQTFVGPDNLSDVDAYQRAVQERDIASGRVQTTFAGGATKALGEDRATTGALLNGVGYAASAVAPPVGAGIVAATPLLTRGIEYVTRRLTGQEPDAPTLSELGMDAGIGAAQAYGPGLLAGGASRIAGAMSRAPASGMTGWAVKEAAPIAGAVASGADALSPAAQGRTVQDVLSAIKQAAMRAASGISADDVTLATEHIQKGMAPSTAFRIVAGSDPKKVAALKSLYIQSRLVAARALVRP